MNIVSKFMTSNLPFFITAGNDTYLFTTNYAYKLMNKLINFLKMKYSNNIFKDILGNCKKRTFCLPQVIHKLM